MAERIPFWLPQVGGDEAAGLQAVLESNFLNDGPVTARFEEELGALVGAKYVVTSTSGTTALFLALAAAGVGHGDEVIVPDVTFIASANAVTLTGATPVLVDVDPGTMCICPEAAERAVTSRTKAIMPVHVSGRPADMRAIVELAKRRGLVVVEDAAEGLLSKSGGRCLGTIGNAGCFSFSPNKTITTGQGGAVVTDDEQLFVRMRELKDQGRPARGTGGADTHVSLGFNFKFTNLQAAVGLAQLKRLPERIERLRRLYEIYADRLAGVDEVEVLPFDLAGGGCPQWVDVFAERRDALDDHLRRHGMGCRKFWFPLHTQAPYLRPDAEFPVSTRSVPRALWLPSAFTIRDEECVEVCERIREFYGAARDVRRDAAAVGQGARG